MHDSEQEHSGITGCRVTYESTIFYTEANKVSIIVVKTSDPRIPPQACSGRYYGDRMLRFTAVGYELPRTKANSLAKRESRGSKTLWQVQGSALLGLGAKPLVSPLA